MTGILLHEKTGDLLVKAGLLAVGDTTAQVAERLLLANRGEFKEFPLLGGEAARLQNGVPDPMWSGEVKRMLITCGVPAERVTLENGIITIE